MEEKTDIKAKTIKVDTGKGNTIKVTMSYGAFCALRRSLQFTTPSGLHSVLERPFSEANGRPFLVKRSPLIVC